MLRCSLRFLKLSVTVTDTKIKF